MASSERPQLINDDATMSTFQKRVNEIKLLDTHKTQLLEDLNARYEYVSGRFVEECANFDRERAWAASQLEISQQSTLQLQESLDRDPFVLVLIDGADLIFRNAFLNDGDAGGRRCAAMLHQAVNEHVFSTIDELPTDTAVFVRMYVDLEGLVGTALQSNIVDPAVKIKSFVRGFVHHRATFDIINVYSQGRETIIDKVEVQLKQHLFDLRCRQIILGCSDGDIYCPMLKPVAMDESLQERITILSGEPLEASFSQLPFASVGMPEIFRNTKVGSHQTIDHTQKLEGLPQAFASPLIGRQFGVMTPPPSTPSLSIRSDSRAEVIHAVKTSVSTSSSEALERSPPRAQPLSWASTAKKASALPTTVSIKPVRKETTPTIRRNKHGQRLDPAPPEFKKDEVNHVRKLKLCNSHYLRADCEYPDAKCSHDHFYKLSKSEMESLKLVARMSACVYGTECTDEKCIYGHNCPFPKAKEGSMRGKGCLNGDNCRFPPHMHGQDMIPVKLVKVT